MFLAVSDYAMHGSYIASGLAFSKMIWYVRSCPCHDSYFPPFRYLLLLPFGTSLITLKHFKHSIRKTHCPVSFPLYLHYPSLFPRSIPSAFITSIILISIPTTFLTLIILISFRAPSLPLSFRKLFHFCPACLRGKRFHDPWPTEEPSQPCSISRPPLE